MRVTVKDPRNGKATQVNLEPDDFAESLRGMIYKPDTMRGIPLLLHKAAGGDYQAFADYQIGRNTAFNADIADGLYFSITCTEDIDRLDPQQVHANGRGTSSPTIARGHTSRLARVGRAANCRPDSAKRCSPTYLC